MPGYADFVSLAQSESADDVPVGYSAIVVSIVSTFAWFGSMPDGAIGNDYLSK